MRFPDPDAPLHELKLEHKHQNSEVYELKQASSHPIFPPQEIFVLFFPGFLFRRQRRKISDEIRNFDFPHGSRRRKDPGKINLKRFCDQI